MTRARKTVPPAAVEAICVVLRVGLAGTGGKSAGVEERELDGWSGAAEGLWTAMEVGSLVIMMLEVICEMRVGSGVSAVSDNMDVDELSTSEDGEEGEVGDERLGTVLAFVSDLIRVVVVVGVATLVFALLVELTVRYCAKPDGTRVIRSLRSSNSHCSLKIAIKPSSVSFYSFPRPQSPQFEKRTAPSLIRWALLE